MVSVTKAKPLFALVTCGQDRHRHNVTVHGHPVAASGLNDEHLMVPFWS
jgi:hypothetical protein